MLLPNVLPQLPGSVRSTTLRLLFQVQGEKTNRDLDYKLLRLKVCCSLSRVWFCDLKKCDPLQVPCWACPCHRVGLSWNSFSRTGRIKAAFNNLWFWTTAVEETLGVKDESSLEILTAPASLEIKLQNLKL